VSRYFIWDGIRALDYLLGRAEVDPTRVGAAGCSGGGALTTFVAALDERIKAVVPACFPNSYRVLFAGPNSDSEMSWPNFLAKGLDVADFVELSAPTPWLLQATKDDYFTPQGAQLVYAEARRWYALYGAEDKVRLFIGSGPHGTPLESREAIYEWMIRWLKDGQGDSHEAPVHLFANHELQVTASGHVDSETGSRKLYQLILDDYHAKAKAGTIPELLAELRRLKIASSTQSSVNPVTKLSGKSKALRQEIRFESEPGIELGAKLYVPSSSGRKPGILLIADDSTSKFAERLAQSEHVVLELEPRNSPQENDRRPFLGNWLVNARANQIGLVLPALRAHDIVRGVDVLAAREDVDPTSIRAAAKGVKGIWLLLAAAIDTRISKIWLDRTPYSLQAALERSINTELFDAAIPGFVLRWDLSDLVQAMGNRKVLWTDPTNWMSRSAPLGPPFRYRYVLGDTTDLTDAQDIAYADEWLR
jgi:hypothetical protein